VDRGVGTRRLWWALAIYVLVALIITLSARGLDDQPKALALRLLAEGYERGLTDVINYDTVDFIANVVFLAPLSYLIARLAGPHRLWLAPVAVTASAALVETVQLLFLPDRVATVLDVAAAAIGALLGTWFARHRMEAKRAHVFGRSAVAEPKATLPD
jgi:glycopeptide antibiotics resistance protein